ncbi:MAG: NfeD family protein, partial [Rhodomicrobium sp.]|nr:NfeD family protein [Rhodomicrobium sp.]
MEGVLSFFAREPGWAWLIVASILFALDIMAPGFYMVWFGLAAVAVGAFVFAVPLPIEWQILVFCAACLISLAIGRALWSGSRADVSDKPLLNQRARQLIGRTFVLATPIHGDRDASPPVTACGR